MVDKVVDVAWMAHEKPKASKGKREESKYYDM